MPLPTVVNERNRTGRSENEVRVLTIDARAQLPALPVTVHLLYGTPRPLMGALGFNFVVDDDIGLSRVPHSNGERPTCAFASS